jgi:hypothetical protein
VRVAIFLTSFSACFAPSLTRLPRSVVGSEFVQKYLGEGPRMVRDVFRMAKENSPSIIFIDEIDAIATKRFDAQTGGACTNGVCLLSFFPSHMRTGTGHAHAYAGTHRHT